MFGQWRFNYGIHESAMTWLQSYIPFGITKEQRRERERERIREGEEVENEKKIQIQSGVLEMGKKRKKAYLPLRGES